MKPSKAFKATAFAGAILASSPAYAADSDMRDCDPAPQASDKILVFPDHDGGTGRDINKYLGAPDSIPQVVDSGRENIIACIPALHASFTNGNPDSPINQSTVGRWIADNIFRIEEVQAGEPTFNVKEYEAYVEQITNELSQAGQAELKAFDEANNRIIDEYEAKLNTDNSLTPRERKDMVSKMEADYDHKYEVRKLQLEYKISNDINEKLEAYIKDIQSKGSFFSKMAKKFLNKPSIVKAGKFSIAIGAIVVSDTPENREDVICSGFFGDCVY